MSEHIKDYLTLAECYDYFNKELFEGSLSGCVLSFESKGQHFGYYCKNGFVDREGGTRDEISLNPNYFLHKSGDLELLQTLVHEMCHQWQCHFGKPSLRTYHNKEFSEVMERVGLMTSETGEPGGKRTGQKMADYPIEGGLFLKLATKLLEEGGIISYYRHKVLLDALSEGESPLHTNDTYKPVLDRLEHELSGDKTEEGITGDKPRPQTPSKVKYSCSNCNMNVWGKEGLHIICGECKVSLDRIKSYS